MTRRVVNGQGQFLREEVNGTATPLGAELMVAPEGRWGVHCGSAHHLWHPRPRPIDERMNICAECGRGLDDCLAVINSDVELIETPEKLYERRWYHASVFRSIDMRRSDTMHWGSCEAALERAHAFLWSGRDSYLHEASLNPDLIIHDDVMLERPGMGTNHTHGRGLLAECDVVRYINGTEAPGAVSLMLLPSSFREVSLVGPLHIASGTVELNPD